MTQQLTVTLKLFKKKRQQIALFIQSLLLHSVWNFVDELHEHRGLIGRSNHEHDLSSCTDCKRLVYCYSAAFRLLNCTNSRGVFVKYATNMCY